jgi:lipopolysaccharide export system permease protein
MKILRAYLLREHAAPFAVTLGGLTAVLLIGNMVKFAELVIAKGVNPLDLLRLIIYLVPYLISYTIPMACFVAMVLAFGRLSTDYELIAMRASGIAPGRLVAPLLVAALVISGGLLVLNDRIVPAAHLAFRRQLKAIGIKQPTAYLEAGTFIKEFAPYVIFVYHVQGRKLHNVRIYEPQPNGPTRTILADRGEFERLPGKEGVMLRLFDGTVDEWDPEEPGAFFKVSYSTYAMKLQAGQEDAERVGKKLKELTFHDLAQEDRRLAAQGIETLPISLELHRRVASAFAPLVFALFGLAFGLRLQHHERLMTFVWVLAIFILYYLGSVGMNAAALKGWLPAWLAMWLPNLAGAGAGASLLGRALR